MENNRLDPTALEEEDLNWEKTPGKIASGTTI